MNRLQNVKGSTRGMAILNAIFDNITADGDSVEEFALDCIQFLRRGEGQHNVDEETMEEEDNVEELTYLHLRNAGFSPAHRYLKLEDINTEHHETREKIHEWCMSVAKLPYLSTVRGLLYRQQTALQKATHKTRLDKACIMMLNLLYEVHDSDCLVTVFDCISLI